MDKDKMLVRIERFERKVGEDPWPWTETGWRYIYADGDEYELFEMGPFEHAQRKGEAR